MVQRKTAVKMYNTPSNKSSDNTTLLLDFVVDIDSKKNHAELQFWNILKSMTITNISVMFYVSINVFVKHNITTSDIGLLPDTENCGLRMHRECRERFPLPPTSKKTANQWSRHASRHVRHARAEMHVGIAYLRRRGKRPRIPGARPATILRIWQDAH